MLHRKIEEDLKNWKETKLGLFLDGPRQVGKTYILNYFAKQNFKNVIYINFYEDKMAKLALDIEYENVQSFMLRLKAYLNVDDIPTDTAIILDEIQELKKLDIVTLSKFLVSSTPYRWILSGSLLGVTLNNIASWPMGYVTSLTLYPLDFEEFLWAKGISKSTIELIKDCFYSRKTPDEFIHKKIMTCFKEYLLTGGLPKAVETFVETNDLGKANEVFESLNNYYLTDITKYAPKENRLDIMSIYELIPEEINKESKRFNVKDIENYKKKDYKTSFNWLYAAGIAIPVFNVKEAETPLRLNTERTLLKLFSFDTGLLTYKLMDPSLKIKILNEDKDINFGAIYENAVAVLLHANGFDKLYYYNNKKYGEVDFLIERGGEVIPLEIKSGKAFKIHSGIDNIIKIRNYNIKEGYVFSNDREIKKEESLVYFPIYMIAFLKKKLGVHDYDSLLLK